MSHCLPQSAIHVKELNLWAHVGVLSKERLLGQSFLLDFSLWLDLGDAAIRDDLTLTADYSLGVTALQKLSFEIKCLTIEHFGHQILNCLESIYGAIPMQITLRKCSPPIPGFSGNVSIECTRNFPLH